LATVPLFPAAIDEVNAWLSALGPGVAERQPGEEIGEQSAVWRLAMGHLSLEGTSPCLILMQDFPARPARIKVSPTLCLRLPHIEADGNFCHGIETAGDDIDSPTKAVGRVLQCFDEYLEKSVQRGWREAEFQAERLNYWDRWVDRAKCPAVYPATEILLDAVPNDSSAQVFRTISLAGGKKAFAVADGDEPDAVAKSRGWAVGTLTHGATLVVQLSAETPWTPSTWPKSFADLDELISVQTGKRDLVTQWYSTTKWPNKAPVFVAVLHGTAAFGWSLIPNVANRRWEPSLAAVQVTRVDRNWALARDRAPDQLAQRTAKHVVVLGIGALGSAVAELLARAGVGQVDLVDPESFEPENTSRHLLGMPDLGKSKAETIARRLQKNIPGVKVRGSQESATRWAAALISSSVPDLVVDCTGERKVRLILTNLRASKLKDVPVVMGWMEPFGAAAHVIVIAATNAWPVSDPVDTQINYALWPDSAFIALPACGQGFHEYGVADAWAAAALVTERTLATLSTSTPPSGVWSRVRSHAFFEAAVPGVVFNRANPCPATAECVVIHRTLAEALNAR
jgi:hypothetical protein